MKTPSRTAVSRIFLIAMSNMAVLFVCLVIIELIFGRWTKGNQALWRLNIPQNMTITRDISGLYPSATGRAVYKVDANGLRGPFERPATIDILTMGGSTTAQSDISDGETWQDVMASDFKRAGMAVEIANAGVNGQSVFGHARNFKIWLPYIPELKPRFILAYIGVNDYCADPAFYKDYMLENPTWKAYFKRKSALYLLYRMIRGMYLYFQNERYRTPYSPWDKPLTDKPLIDDHEARMKERLEVYRKKVKLLVRRIRKFGSTPVLVTQSMFSHWHSDGKFVGVNDPYDCCGRRVNGLDEFYILDLFNKSTLAVCREENLTCFDLAQELQFERADFSDDMHNTPRGTAKIGHYLYEKFKPVLTN